MIQVLQFYYSRFSKSMRTKFVALLVCSLVVSGIVILIPLIQKNILDSIELRNLSGLNLVRLLGLSFFNLLLIAFEAWLLNALFMEFQRGMQFELYQSGIRHPNDILQKRGPGAYMVNILGDSEQMALILNHNIFHTLFAGITSLIVILITLQWTYVFAVTALISGGLMIGLMIIANRKYKQQFGKAREHVYQINPILLENLENRDLLLSEANLTHFDRSLYETFETRDGYFKKAFAVSSISDGLIRSIQSFALIVFFILSAVEIARDKQSFSTFIVMLNYFAIVFLPIFLIKDIVANVAKFNMLVQKISPALKTEIKYRLSGRKTLALNNCSLYYTPNDKILDDVSLRLTGQLGLIGLSGEGKSSIFKLILGDLEPTSGQCVYGQYPTGQLNRFVHQSRFRIYRQDNFFFDNDLAYNITLGRTGLAETEYQSKVHQTLDQLIRLQSDGFQESDFEFMQLIWGFEDRYRYKPETFDRAAESLAALDQSDLEQLAEISVERQYYITERYAEIVSDLGLEYLSQRKFGQRGNSLSGGEKNMVSLARFLLPVKKQYYLIDEPFTSADILLEQKGSRLIKKYLRDEAGLIISHKLHLVKELSDEIVLLDQAKIVTQGSHEQLLQQSALYRNLWSEYCKTKEHPMAEYAGVKN